MGQPLCKNTGDKAKHDSKTKTAPGPHVPIVSLPEGSVHRSPDGDGKTQPSYMFYPNGSTSGQIYLARLGDRHRDSDQKRLMLVRNKGVERRSTASSTQPQPVNEGVEDGNNATQDT
eukprot:gb/GECG01009406.1/.p1 GENE.gb/GECG01009406.1/~~gb/GECG01009406.1/.p1  ORF type:complete len:117 (+),score=8.03 gb/GECG01009406.1/:1-351(+)